MAQNKCQMIVDDKVCGRRIDKLKGMCFKCAFEKKTIEEGEKYMF